MSELEYIVMCCALIPIIVFLSVYLAGLWYDKVKGGNMKQWHFIIISFFASAGAATVFNLCLKGLNRIIKAFLKEVNNHKK